MADVKEGSGPTVKLQFHYIKGPSYREELCHGAFGGLSPQGGIWMSFYAERYPIPRVIEYEIAGTLDQAITFNEQDATPSNIEGRQGVIRHVETTVYMSIETAKRVRDWLNRMVETSEPMQRDTNK